MSFKEYIMGEYSLPSDSGGVVHYNTDGTVPQQSPNDFTRPDSPGEVPQHNIGLPQVNRRSKVVGIDHKAGGVTEVRLEDRTVLRLTSDQVKRIAGDPLVPHRSIVTVFFQRNPSDHGQTVSQITKISCENTPIIRTQTFNAS